MTTDIFIPTAREARSNGCNQLVVAALCASLFIGILQQFNHMEDQKWRRKIELEREERRASRERG